MATNLELQVYQTVLAEHGGNFEHAFIDLCGRFVKVMNGVSPGFLRWPPEVPAEPKVDVPPNPITDEWISTGVDA